VVEAGAAVCARCGRPIMPGSAFDLDHTPDRADNLGVSHPGCNRRTSTHRVVARRTMLADPDWTGLRSSTGMRVSQEW